MRKPDGGVFYMAKYTKEVKIKLVMEYLSGETGDARLLSKKYNIPRRTIEGWINSYKVYGFDVFEKRMTKKNYTSEFKLSVIQYRQINKISLIENQYHFHSSPTYS